MNTLQNKERRALPSVLFLILFLTIMFGILMIFIAIQSAVLSKQDNYLESLQEEIEICQSENPTAPRCVLKAIPVDPT
jgi:hypothetical protein